MCGTCSQAADEKPKGFIEIDTTTSHSGAPTEEALRRVLSLLPSQQVRWMSGGCMPFLPRRHICADTAW